MTTPGITTPYSTVQPMFGPLPGWVPPLEQQRIESYRVYEDIYWNNPDTFKLTARGSEDRPIYVPTGRTIVDTTNRYVGTGFDFLVDPTIGGDDAKALATKAFTRLFRREKFKSRYAMNKRYGLIRGDWLWHIVADPLKAPGTRISIKAIDPGAWFPVYQDDDLDRLVKIHIAEQFVYPGDTKVWVKRLTYERLPSGQIQASEGIFDLKDWDLSGSPEEVTLPPTTLDPRITAFPVYHIKNFEEPQNPYGSSELRGLERVMAAVNQAVSDQDLALALQGLGLYATDGAGPVDEEGNDIPWQLGPGQVVENALGFKRIDGIGSVQPSLDHIGMLVNFMKEASATPDAAIGKVDVQVAESGVALLLQLGPMLAKAEEKDQEIIDVHTQMFFDLKNWFLVYEGENFVEADVLPLLGSKIPINRDKEIQFVLDMIAAKVMSAQTGRERLAVLGYKFEENEAVIIAQEAALTTESMTPVDPLAERVAAELATLGGAAGEDTPTGNAAS